MAEITQKVIKDHGDGEVEIEVTVRNMKKISQIDNCFHCPLRKHRDGWGNFCEHAAVEHYEIMNIRELPDWCPLPEDD